MDSFFFLLFYFSFIILWFYLLKYSNIKILSVSIPSFLIISLLILQYLGYPILFYFINDYRAQFVQDRNLIFETFFISIYSITLIIIGFFFCK
jgi:hypothetical protein